MHATCFGLRLGHLQACQYNERVQERHNHKLNRLDAYNHRTSETEGKTAHVSTALTVSKFLHGQ